MKHFYLSILLLFSLNLYAQDELLGQWYLHYIEVDGVQQYSTIPNSDNYIFFEDNVDDDLNFYGTVCDNGYGGIFSVIDESNIEISDFAAFAGFCNYPTESNMFLHPYLWTVLSNETGNDVFEYAIAGTGNDQTLLLTNSENNKAFYGRSPLPENRLPGIWYLHKIVKNGVEEINTFNPEFKIDFMLNAGSLFGIYYEGLAICNDYFGAYYLDGIDKVRLEYISFTLSICDLEGNELEESYFSFFTEAQTDSQLLDYEVSGTGDDETLTLTDANGDYALYGRQTLSISENEISNLSIRLNENPVEDELKLTIEDYNVTDLNAQIFSVDGKLILEQNIATERSVNVTQLNSGMYFLVVASDGNFKETLKFIKQ